MKGPYVVMLQKALMKKGYKLPKWGADGSWGAETTAALLLLKKAAGLSSALLVGPKTWKALLS
jgi:N-acetylmuramoyl-L-alanine amidase